MGLTWRVGLKVAGTLLLPFLCMTAYLLIFGRHGTSENGDWAAMGISISLGLAVLMTASLGGWEKAVAAVVYVVVMGIGLFVYALGFVCGAYGRCL